MGGPQESCKERGRFIHYDYVYMFVQGCKSTRNREVNAVYVTLHLFYRDLEVVE